MYELLLQLSSLSFTLVIQLLCGELPLIAPPPAILDLLVLRSPPIVCGVIAPISFCSRILGPSLWDKEGQVRLHDAGRFYRRGLFNEHRDSKVDAAFGPRQLNNFMTYTDIKKYSAAKK